MRNLMQQDLNHILDTLDALEKDVGDDTKAQVEFGDLLCQVITKANGMLEKVKGKMRSEAGKLTGVFDFESEGSFASVKVPEPEYRIRKDADVQKILSTCLYADEMFIPLGYKLSDKFTHLYSRYPESVEKKMITDAIKQVELTPRVSWRKKGGKAPF